MQEEKEYVKLWTSYKAYFEAYSAAEVGRLVLAMIDYKLSGAEPEFSGSERFIWPAIRRDIDMANAAQAELSQKNQENGKRGGRPRKAVGFDENPKNPPVFPETQKRHGQGQGQGHGHGQGQEETSPDGEAKKSAVAAVMNAYLDKITPMPSQTSLDELKGYVEQMGAECCLRAFDIALDAKKANWFYIKGILRKKLSQGVHCIADWDALEERREAERHGGDTGFDGSSAGKWDIQQTVL